MHEPAGFFVTILIAAVMFKSNDIVKKQTALKVMQMPLQHQPSTREKQKKKRKKEKGTDVLFNLSSCPFLLDTFLILMNIEIIDLLLPSRARGKSLF